MSRIQPAEHPPPTAVETINSCVPRIDEMQEGFLSPLQGLVVLLLAYPGLHPGLLHAALPGLKSRKRFRFSNLLR